MTRYSPLAPLAGAAFGLLALAAPGHAQQFQIKQNLPGGHIWTEGLEAADVDNDGDLDMFIANGEGFSSAGPDRQNALAINQLVETAALTWTDESIARLGVHESNAKQVVTGDIQGDGYIDAVFANAFNIELPFLYVNQGSTNPGFFDFDGVNRGLTDVLSSADAVFGDIENDGDLDLILADSGASFLGGAGSVPHVYRNDGNGFFSLDTGAMAGIPNKQAHQDLHLVDIDLDWDLDLWVANHVNNHFLLLNDGAGNFSDSSGLIPSTSGNVYESDVSDLDNDGDMDMFFISLMGFQEGPLENDLIPTTTLGFTKGTPASSHDDNEISFCDYDNDGDLDAFVGSLTSGTEKIRRNDGGLSFSGDSGNVQNFTDSTLDCTHADLDNDGDYDFVTAQGESNDDAWTNKVYENLGAADSLAPVVKRQETLSDCQDVLGPWVVRAEIQDQVMDDGKSWVSAQAIYDVDGNGGTVPGLATGTGMFRFGMTDTADGQGTTLTYQLEFTDWAGNVTTTSPTVVCLCGYGKYSIGVAAANTLDLSGTNPANVGGTVNLTITNVPSAATFTATLISLGSLTFPFLGGTGLVDPTQLVDPILGGTPAGGTAVTSVGIPSNPALAGFSVYFQSVSDDDGLPFLYRLSNGLKLTICP